MTSLIALGLYALANGSPQSLSPIEIAFNKALKSYHDCVNRGIDRRFPEKGGLTFDQVNETVDAAVADCQEARRTAAHDADKALGRDSRFLDVSMRAAVVAHWLDQMEQRLRPPPPPLNSNGKADSNATN